MARPSPAHRLVDVTAAATRMFGKLGYRRTQMAEVAAEAGMASGAIYTYVKSKEALFHHVIEVGFGLSADVIPILPLATPAPGATGTLAGDGLRKATEMPVLRSALDEPSASRRAGGRQARA
jgi:AcrR family transcriptional regulator